MWLLLYHRTHTHGRWLGILAGAAAAPPSAVDGGCPEGAPDGYWLIFRPANGPTWTPYYGSATKRRTANTERKSFNAEWSRTSGSRHNISHSCRPSHSLHWPTPILEPPGYRRHSFSTTVAFDQDATAHSSRSASCPAPLSSAFGNCWAALFTHPSPPPVNLSSP
jgi:hypothetical protein